MANFNFNKIILGGRVASDVRLNVTPSGKSVTSFTLAVNRSSKKKGRHAECGLLQGDRLGECGRILHKILAEGCFRLCCGENPEQSLGG